MSAPAVQSHPFADDGDIPNHPQLPLVLLPQAVRSDGGPEALAAEIERRYRRHGWTPAWRWGVYPFAHYHSTAHEVLGCFRGTARLRFGGENGVTQEIRPGDVVVIPAGVGHQNLGSSDDFQVCGGYPAGQEADLIRADDPAPREAVRARIARVPRPSSDPIFGADGPLGRLWRDTIGG